MTETNLNEILRRSFDSKFPLENATIHVSNACKLDPQTIFQIYSTFNKWGFLIINPVSKKDFREELISLSNLFGNLISHNRSNNDGISLIKPIKGFPDYFGTTSGETGLHTDGSFYEIPPRIMVLQCIVPSIHGGESQLVSSKKIFTDLYKNHPEYIQDLLQPDAFTITRDNQSITRAVFSKKGNKIHTVFRANGTAKVSVPERLSRSFELMKEMVGDPENILQLKLEPHQLLVVDNTNVLHGRTAFSNTSQRTLHRMFLDGKLENQEILQFGFLTNLKI